jgi:hypothetical protein
MKTCIEQGLLAQGWRHLYGQCKLIPGEEECSRNEVSNLTFVDIEFNSN